MGKVTGPMRISTVVYMAILFVIAAGLSVLTAMLAVKTVEDISQTDVVRALSAEGMNWADAEADGLQVFVIGLAPDEATRFKARSVAGTVVDAARVIDQMTVIETRDIAPPEFRLELLRTATGISVFGVLPRRFGTEDLIAELHDIAGEDQRVSDLLDLVEYPAPENWAASVRYALGILKDTQSAKITVSGAAVQGDAVVESQDQKKKLEAKWASRRPEGILHDIKLTAPRPVVSPYTFRAVYERGALKFDACTAQTAVSRGLITKAITELGYEGKLSCQLALGRPTDAWPQVVIKSLKALKSLSGGSVTITDTDIKLVAVEGTDAAAFETVVGTLKASLPAEYNLLSELPVPETEDETIQDFTIVRSPEGLVQLWGEVSSDISLEMVRSVAVANFGNEKTHLSVQVNDALKNDWSPQILTTLDAMELVQKGKAIINQSQIDISGTSDQEKVGSDIAVLFSGKENYAQSLVLNIQYVEPEISLPDQPTAQDCVEEINGLLETRKINFEPGSDRVDVEGLRLLDDIAEVLRECTDIPLMISGHTDSQGSENMNRALSQSRANAVLMELQKRRILTSSFVAKGYGEERPIASNDTKEGREKNRRIEFTLAPIGEQDKAQIDEQKAQ